MPAIKAFSQPVTFADLLYLRHQKSARAFLTPKNYLFDAYSGNPEMYFKNRGTSTEEKITFSIHENKAYVSYSTNDTTYMHIILTEIYKNYKLILKDSGNRETFYRFADADIDIMLDILKPPSTLSKMTIGPFQ